MPYFVYDTQAQRSIQPTPKSQKINITYFYCEIRYYVKVKKKKTCVKININKKNCKIILRWMSYNLVIDKFINSLSSRLVV